MKLKGGKLFTAFIDFKGAFDETDRNILFKKMDMGIRGTFLRMIISMYRETKYKIKTNQGLSTKFRYKKGVRQGCPLSPILFNIFINDLEDSMIRRNEGGTVIGNIKIYCLKYADDIVLLADDQESLKDSIKNLENFTTKNKMTLSLTKNKIVIFKNEDGK